MLVLITGGAASGKSEYAESVARRIPGKRYVYLATMTKDLKENRDRIFRHRQMREGKGFDTVERSNNIKHIAFTEGTVVLLECLSNLLANEMFSPFGPGINNAEEEVKQGILSLLKQGCDLVVVSNDIFADGNRYDKDTRYYQMILGNLHRWIGEQADAVIEVSCGIACIQKKGTNYEALGIV